MHANSTNVVIAVTVAYHLKSKKTCNFENEIVFVENSFHI